MSPFTIQCTTCDARLSVRKRAAVGKIFACPSCGGMVLAEHDLAKNRREDNAQRHCLSRWRESQSPAKSSTAALDASYDIVNEILDCPPVTSQDFDSSIAASMTTATASARHVAESVRPGVSRRGSDLSSTESGRIASRVGTPFDPAANRPKPMGDVPKSVLRRSRAVPGPRKSLFMSLLVGAALALGLFHVFNNLTTPADGTATSINAAGVVALKPVLPDKAAVKRTLGARLRQPLAGVPQTASLPAFLQFVSRGSEVPIALDVDSLKYSRIGLNTPVTVQDPAAPIFVVLQKSLRPLQLSVEMQDAYVFVTSTILDETDDLRHAQHDISDLVTAELTADALGAWIRDFVRPESWDTRGGSGTMQMVGDILTIDQTRRVHLDVLSFCDGLRAARGLPVRGRQVAFNAAQTVSPNAIRTLESRIDVHCQRPTQLSHAVAQIEKVASCRLLIDWQALYAAGRSFDDRVIIACQATPLGEVLERIVDQLQLTYRMVGPNAIEITTKQAESAAELVVFHPLVGGEETMDLAVTRSGAQQLAAGPGRHFAYEPVSGTLAARLPWSLQRRLAHRLP